MNPRNVDVRKGTKGVLSLKVETSLLRLEKLPTFVDIFGFGMSNYHQLADPLLLGFIQKTKVICFLCSIAFLISVHLFTNNPISTGVVLLLLALKAIPCV